MSRQFFKLLCLLALTLVAGRLDASPMAAPVVFTVTQPDGTTIQLQPKGNGYADWMETDAGYTVVRKNDTWFFAERAADGQLRASGEKVGATGAPRKSRRKHIRPPVDLDALPRFSSPHRRVPPPASRSRRVFTAQSLPMASQVNQPLLVILVSFSDRDLTYSAPSFADLVFGNAGSAKQYYLENSYNQFVLVPAVETQGTANDGVITVSLPTAHPDSGNTDSGPVFEIVEDALSAASAYIDFAGYDTDADGAVDADELSVLLVAAGYENAFAGELTPSPNIWAFASRLPALTLDGVSIPRFALIGEIHGIGGASDHQASVGIICHELGHLFLGLPDLYDRDGSSEGIGRWGLMGSGSWNHNGSQLGDSPAHLIGWSKLQVGFVIPDDIENIVVSEHVDATSSAPSIKRIWVDRYRSMEHFLVENRALSGFDAGLPGAGLIISHINPAVATQNDDESNKLVDVEAADARQDMDLLVNRGDTGDVFPGTMDNRNFDALSSPSSLARDGGATAIGVLNVSSPATTMYTDIMPRSISFGTAIGDDEFGVNWNRVGYANTTVWTALRTSNPTAETTLDGFELFIDDSANVDFYWYETIVDGRPENLLHLETGFSVSPGWARILLNQPQPFPQGVDRVMVLRIVTNADLYPAYFDAFGPPSGGSYTDADGEGSFYEISTTFGDLNQHLLLSSLSAVTPLSVDGTGEFGNVELGTASRQPIVITNTGNATFDISAVDLSGAHVGDFSIVLDSGETTLAPGAERMLVVEFVPTSRSIRTAQLSIVSNSPQGTVIQPLSGSGQASEISVSPSTISFGSRKTFAGAGKPQTVTITNTGNGELVVSDVQLTLDDSSQFEITADTGETVLRPNQSRIIQVAFAPTSGGNKHTLLQIASDAFNEAAITVSLSGTGIVDASVSSGAGNAGSSGGGGCTLQLRARFDPLLPLLLLLLYRRVTRCEALLALFRRKTAGK